MDFVAWATLTAAVIAAAASVTSAVLQRRTARESNEVAETRAKREEVGRTLRWAAEKALSSDPRESRLGIDELETLYVSSLLADDLLSLVDAALAAVVDARDDEIDVIENDGDAARILESDRHSADDETTGRGILGEPGEEGQDG